MREITLSFDWSREEFADACARYITPLRYLLWLPDGAKWERKTMPLR